MQTRQFFDRWSDEAAKERHAQEENLWFPVLNGKHRNYHKRTSVFGSKAVNNNSIAGQPTPRQFSAFVAGIHPEITEQQLSDYMTQEVGITPITIASNKRNKYNQSFKVIVQYKDKDSIFNPEAWDNNINIKAFRERQNENKSFTDERWDETL